MTIQDISLRRLSGRKMGGSQKKPTQTSDNLFSTDIVEALIGVSEGPIKGLVDGAKSYLIGETPLQDPGGNSNFDNFELITYKGSPDGEEIYSRLGGFGASTTVSTQLAPNTPVIRQGQHDRINYLDVRFAINQLFKSNDSGTFEHTGQWRIEYKPVSATNWTLVQTAQSNPLPPRISGDSYEIFYGTGSAAQANGAPGDRPTYWTSSQPVSTANAGIWFDTSKNYAPKVFDGTNWFTPTGAVFADNHWTWSEPSQGSDGLTRAFVGAEMLAGRRYERGDYWLHTGQNRALFYNGSTWVVAGSTLRPGTFGENSTGGSVSVEAGVITLTGKTTSAFPKEFRIPVPEIDEPYMLRVTRITGANTTELFFDITWESFQEVTAKAYSFKNLAATHLVARASEQFSSLPDLSGIYDGRLVRVPSNYNPDTRVYTGVWDGTWKIAYTNNPAFVAYDLVSNDVYGMNAYYPITLNKWDVYEAGQWCDQLTANGRPRFTYNGLISDPRGGREALNYICGIFAGRFFDDGNGTGVIKIDKDDGASLLFTPENVVEGIFTYSFTEISTRHNDVTVSFVNPELNWQEDRRRVFEQAHIDKYNRIPHNFIAVGCTSAEEAIVRARYHLITGISETMMVNFKTNRLGLYLSPYDVILVSDPDMETGLTGRVQRVLDARTIELRDPLHFEPGFNYRISFQTLSPISKQFVLEHRDLPVGWSGSFTELTVTEDLPALPAECVFTIEQTNGDAAPVAFRVMNISEIDGDPDNIEIQAMQMNRAKWLYIDGDVGTVDELDQSIIGSRKKPQPATNLRVTARTRRQGTRDTATLTLDWDLSPSKLVGRYRVEASRNNGPMSTIAEMSGNQFEWENAVAGEYLFALTAIDINGNESAPIFTEHRLIGDYRDVEAVAGLRMVDEPSEVVFESRSPTFSWATDTTEYFAEYVVQITTPDGQLIREQVVTEPRYTYEFAFNLNDNGGTPRRTFRIRVASRDQFGFMSRFEELLVGNPPPARPQVQSLTIRRNTPIVTFEPPADRDYVGVMIHASLTEGFEPNEANLVYKGPNTDVPLDLPNGQTSYVRIAFYDVFGTTGLNYGYEMSADVPTGEVVDLIPPGPPRDLIGTAGPGMLVLEWTNASDSDLDYVELFFSTSDDVSTARFGAASNADNAVIGSLTPGIECHIWARSVDTSGNRSEWTLPALLTPRALGTVYIEDGSILAEKIASKAITAGKLNVENLSSVAADMGTITAGMMRSTDGKFVIDLNAKTISIEV